MADPPLDHGLERLGVRTEREIGRESPSADSREIHAGNDDDEAPDGDADEFELGFAATSGDLGELGVDLSPWAPLLGMLDSTEPEVSPGDRPFTPAEGVDGAHALELRAESMLLYAERGARRTGALDRTEVGDSDDKPRRRRRARPGRCGTGC